VEFPGPPPGVYVVTVECASLRLTPDRTPPLTLKVTGDGPQAPAGKGK